MIGHFFKGITSAFGRAEDEVHRALHSIERRVNKTLNRFTKVLILSAVEGSMYVVSGVLILASLVLFINRFLSLDFSLLLAGLIGLYVALLLKIAK